MSEISTRLSEQRERLIAQAEEQRTELAQNIEPWRLPLARVDQGLDVLRFFKRHPVWLIGGVTLMTAMSFKRGGKWLQSGLFLWRVVRKLREG